MRPKDKEGGIKLRGRAKAEIVRAGHDRNGMRVKGANAWVSDVWATAETETGERAESLSLIALGVWVRELSGSDEPAPRSK